MNADPRLVVLECAQSNLMAEELKSLLESEGIDAFLDPYSVEEAVAGEFYLGFGGIDVMIREADLARARELLAGLRQAATTPPELAS